MFSAFCAPFWAGGSRAYPSILGGSSDAADPARVGRNGRYVTSWSNASDRPERTRGMSVMTCLRPALIRVIHQLSDSPGEDLPGRSSEMEDHHDLVSAGSPSRPEGWR